MRRSKDIEVQKQPKTDGFCIPFQFFMMKVDDYDDV